MKTTILVFGFILALGAGYAIAQSTATPIQMGLLKTSGCSGSLTPCWVPISSSNPLPVQLAITP